MNRPIKILLALGVLGALFLGFYLLRPPPPLPPLPKPNGYDDFVKAGQIITTTSSDYRKLGLEELRALVASNATGLRWVREGFNQDCRVPIGFSPNYFEEHLPEIASFKRLAFAFAAEGTLAEMEGRTNDAARIYLDLIRFSHELARGGVVIDKLGSLPLEDIGSRSLGKLIRTLNAKDCRDAIQILETIEDKSESAEDILDHEREWARRAGTWKEKMGSPVGFRALRAAKQNLIKHTRDRDRQRRLLLLDLAARTYELEKGQLPSLVPSYVNAIPQDPHTGTNLLYHFR